MLLAIKACGVSEGSSSPELQGLHIEEADHTRAHAPSWGRVGP